jgi:hypothetical protein
LRTRICNAANPAYALTRTVPTAARTTAVRCSELRFGDWVILQVSSLDAARAIGTLALGSTSETAWIALVGATKALALGGFLHRHRTAHHLATASRMRKTPGNPGVFT